MNSTDPQDIEKLLLNRPESIEQLIDGMEVSVYDALKEAIELGKWADGRRLEAEQLNFCLQAVILYEAKHLPEQDRVGFDLSASCESKSDQDFAQRITVNEPREGREGER